MKYLLAFLLREKFEITSLVCEHEATHLAPRLAAADALALHFSAALERRFRCELNTQTGKC
ncbi:hypothetical protein [Ramlibacter aquaticus]|uniref:hypothetical protein n=1 Tax=Ramlibacter aquaticus TaxID=2780094 RepID=UPI001D0F66F1|nr:hypothetical protein [Ramlibacter aquaticus]